MGSVLYKKRTYPKVQVNVADMPRRDTADTPTTVSGSFPYFIEAGASSSSAPATGSIEIFSDVIL